MFGLGLPELSILAVIVCLSFASWGAYWAIQYLLGYKVDRTTGQITAYLVIGGGLGYIASSSVLSNYFSSWMVQGAIGLGNQNLATYRSLVQLAQVLLGISALGGIGFTIAISRGYVPKGGGKEVQQASEPKTDAKFCPSCGTIAETTALFCMKCGHKFSESG